MGKPVVGDGAARSFRDRGGACCDESRHPVYRADRAIPGEMR